MATGEGAEEIVENLPSVTDQIIHEHEEMAEKISYCFICSWISFINWFVYEY